ncbi:MAG: lipoate--protein ligase family protein [Acidobacteria bacterium]|nr:lipoate--protein ligase family protein [Acidobacteriota bacterium]MDW7985030.1 lipoate--protein ligase family protein [Acidobacteriota bacterium]
MPTAYVLQDGPQAGAWNMALDFWLWKTHGPDRPPVVRFYQWVRPTVSLGYHQEVETVVNLKACRDLGVDVVRRPTGGAAVLHHHELTYSVIATPAQLGVARPLEAYERISQALQTALHRLGLPRADIARPARPSGRLDGFCFAETTHYEITVDGRKLIGSAQRWGRSAILQHGSILLDFDDRWTAIFRPGLFRRSFTTLREVCDRTMSLQDLQEALRFGLGAVFQWTWALPPVGLIDKQKVQGLQALFEILV